MTTLKEEREAIVDSFSVMMTQRYYYAHDGTKKDAQDWLRTALISHEEKVMERVIGQQIIKEFIEATPHWHDELIEKDIPCIMCGIIPNNILKVAKALTLPITEENV